MPPPAPVSVPREAPATPLGREGRALSGLRRAVPRPHVGTRLHFLWGGVWSVLCTVVLWAPLLLHWLVRPGAATFHRWLRRWARLILWGGGIRLRVTAAPGVASGALPTPVVFVSNHQNVLDILTTGAGLPVPFGFTAKASLRGLPIIGRVLRRAESVFVDRSSPHRAAAAFSEAAAQIRAGRSVLVFAEGERTWQTALAPFLRGAFLLAVEAGVPLVPVALDGDVGLLDERHWASRPGRARLVLGRALPTAGCTRRDVPHLMAEVRAWIEAELGGEGEGVSGGKEAEEGTEG